MIGVCITTLNEAGTIEGLVRYFATKDGFQVYVVDDRSTDDTPWLAMKAGARFTQVNGQRVGIAQSLMTAWREAIKDGCDKILQIDAGGSHDVLDADEMLMASEAYDLVIGSRFLRRSRYFVGEHKLRPYLSQFAAMLCNWAHGSGWSDWTSGYRVFSRRCAEHLLTYNYLSKMHGWQIETLARAGAQGFRITEMPIYYTAGRSSFSWKVAWEAFMAWTDLAHHIGPLKWPGRIW